jgi:outer membrane protein insertion porin family
VPRDLGLKGAVFYDAGSVFGFHGQTNFTNGGRVVPYDTAPLYTQGNTITVGGNTTSIRSAAGVSLIWASPLGPIRFDFAKAITKNLYDQTQIFRFSGGATF